MTNNCSTNLCINNSHKPFLTNIKQCASAKQCSGSDAVLRAERSFGSEPLLGSLSASGGAPTVNAAGAAVQRVMDEEITLHTEHTVTQWTGEYLETQTGSR